MENGWTEIKLSKNSLENLNELVSYRHSITDDLNDRIVNKDDFQVEIIKSAIRSLIRYSYQSKYFVKAMVEDLVDYSPDLNNFYITPPYLITHLPNDMHEKGEFHNDTLKHCGRSYTSWTPINNFEMSYAPLSMLNKSHVNYLKIVYKILNKVGMIHRLKKITKFLFIKPFALIPNKDSTYFWHSDLIHRGNLNHMNKLHIALVTRISEKPLYYEPTIRISKMLDIKDFKNDKNNFTIDTISLILSDICAFAVKEKNINNLIRYSNDIKDNTDKNLIKYISFSLSILAQRFIKSDFSSSLDLMSFMLGKENLVSLERFLVKFKHKDVSNDIIKNFYLDTNLLSYQENFIIKKFKGEDIENIESFKKASWLK